jgi:hypothetical protein
MMLFFWVLKPFRLVGTCQRFEETCFLRLQPWRWRPYISSKRWHLPTRLHGSKPRRTATSIKIFLHLIKSYLKVTSFSSSGTMVLLKSVSCSLMNSPEVTEVVRKRFQNLFHSVESPLRMNVNSLVGWENAHQYPHYLTSRLRLATVCFHSPLFSARCWVFKELQTFCSDLLRTVLRGFTIRHIGVTPDRTPSYWPQIIPRDCVRHRIFLPLREMSGHTHALISNYSRNQSV